MGQHEQRQPEVPALPSTTAHAVTSCGVDSVITRPALGVPSPSSTTYYTPPPFPSAGHPPFLNTPPAAMHPLPASPPPPEAAGQPSTHTAPLMPQPAAASQPVPHLVAVSASPLLTQPVSGAEAPDLGGSARAAPDPAPGPAPAPAAAGPKPLHRHLPFTGSTRALRDLHFLPLHLTEELSRAHQRLFEDVVFDEKRWERHRDSWHRHKVELKVFARVVLGFVWQILLVELISVAVGLYHLFLVPLGAPPTTVYMANVFNILTFALSLLLVFKTNSSFARWWEARVVWGTIVNFARNYSRLMLQWSSPTQQHLCHMGVTWAIAAPHILRAYIRQMGADAFKEASHVLGPADLQYLSEWRNPPTGVARMLSWVIAELKLNPEQQRQLEDQVVVYVNSAGACERIYKTPIPAAYTRHTSRFLMMFIVAAPVLLWSSTQWCTLFIMPFIAFLLLGTENIGVQIEEPFRVLPLDAICK